MSSLKKKRGANEDEGRNGSAHSSYAQLKSKCMLLKDELDKVCKEGAELRREKELVGTELSEARRALEVAQRKNDEVLGLIDQFCKEKGGGKKHNRGSSYIVERREYKIETTPGFASCTDGAIKTNNNR